MDIWASGWHEEKKKTSEKTQDVGKEDTQTAGVTEEDPGDKIRWRQVMCCCDP